MRSRSLLLLLVLAWASPAAAQISLVGDWSSRMHEDPTRGSSELGDFTGLPVTKQAIAEADVWDESRWTLQEMQCIPHSSTWAFRGPAQIRIWEEKDQTTQDVIAIKTFIATFAQTRTIWMDGRPRPSQYAAHTWQGFSLGRWEGNMLVVETTHLKRFFRRRNGVPESDRITQTEYFIRHGNNYLTHVMSAFDPVYMTEPMVLSQNFIAVSNVSPAAYQTHVTCQPDEEIGGRAKDYFPHFLPGQTEWIDEYAKLYGIPWEATRGGANTIYPEYKAALKELYKKPNASSAPATPEARPAVAPPSRPPQGDDLEIVQVKPDVYMIAGGGAANVTVNVGSQGLFVVDSGSEAMSAKTVAAIRRISDKPIRYLVNTSADLDHVGGNPAVDKLGAAIPTRELIEEGAVIIAHEKVLHRMSAPTGKVSPTPVAAWPTATFFVERKDMYVNEQPIQLFWEPAAHTDGDVIVLFRRSDVISAGDIFDKTRYPAIDLARGGSINGEIAAIRHLLDLIVTGEKEEGGTLVVPGHGRLCDEREVSNYRDMLIIVRDRVQDMIKKGMALEQVKAAKPTFEFDPEYGASDAFVEAVYQSLRK